MFLGSRTGGWEIAAKQSAQDHFGFTVRNTISSGQFAHITPQIDVMVRKLKGYLCQRGGGEAAIVRRKDSDRFKERLRAGIRMSTKAAVKSTLAKLHGAAEKLA